MFSCRLKTNTQKLQLMNIVIRFSFIAFVMLLACDFAISQTAEDFKIAKMLFTDSDSIKHEKYTRFDNPNELQLLAYGSFSFYKYFFSSQDGDRCVFIPSCSAYTLQSMKKHGFFVGLLDGLDRLQRCNKLSATNYERYKNTSKFDDPVD